MRDLNLFCRLCLKESENAENVKEMFNIESDGLSNKIIFLTGLELQNNDSLPKNICRDCRYQVEKSYYLRLVAKQSDIRLRKYLRLSKKSPLKKSNLLDKDYQDEDTEELRELRVDSYKFFTEAEQEVANLKKNLQAKLEEHERLQTALEEPQAPKTRKTRSSHKTEPVILNSCISLSQNFEGTPTLRRRLKSPEKYPKVSTSCSYEIEILSETADEIQLMVPEEKLVTELQVFELENFQQPPVNQSKEEEEEIESVASESDEDYIVPVKKLIPKRKSSTQVTKIRKNPKKISPKKSTIVQKQDTIDDSYYFKAIGDVENATLDDNGEKKIFQCAFAGCSESFAGRQSCKTHFFNHKTSGSVKKDFKCKFCQKRFHVVSLLERHERVHTGDKPFKCDLAGCTKAFSQREMLKRHKLVHTAIEDAPFSCKICNKKFRQKAQFNQHTIKAHSEDAETHSFECKVCHKSFAHSSGLSRHLLIHSGRKYICEVCDRTFNDQSALKRHSKLHNK